MRAMHHARRWACTNIFDGVPRAPWRCGAVLIIFLGMPMPFDPTDYSVVVKLRAPPPNPWRWEIYRAGRANAVEQAPVFFPTMAAAGRAGKVALKQLLDGRAAARGSVLWGLRS